MRHELVEMARERFAGALRHCIFGRRREALLDRNRRGVEYGERVAAIATQRGAEIEETVGIDSQEAPQLVGFKEAGLAQEDFRGREIVAAIDR